MRSYTLRALVALGFLLGFYLLVFGIAGFCLGVVYFDVTSSKVHARMDIVLGLLGVTVLWSALPRFATFSPPGPRITSADHPRLFALIEDVARRMNQPMPQEVYLVPDVNAFVTQVGGILGFGSRRVMGIGIPLLAIENVSQFKATVAHEFGHFVGGETRLGGLIYTTRASMAQAVDRLGNSALRRPFQWLMEAFMRITRSIGRAQELFADEWSVRIAGKTAHMTGLPLESLHGHGFHHFIEEEVGPLRQRGFGIDNYFEGYRRFLRTAQFARLAPVFTRVAGGGRNRPA